MKLKEIKINNLFGSISPTIDFCDNIKIIYGKNGSGKTTILKIINCIISGQFHQLSRISFENITCNFENNRTLSIMKGVKNKSTDKKNDCENILSITINGKKVTDITDDADIEDIKIPLAFIEREISELERVGEREWRNLSSGALMSISEVLNRYGDKFSWHKPRKQMLWHKEFFNQIDVKFIESQRLMTFNTLNEKNTFFKGSGFRYVDAVSTYSSELRSVIKDKLSESVQISQNLDSSFPKRLLDKDDKFEYNKDAIIDLAQKVVDARNNLEKSGLIGNANDIIVQEQQMSDIERKAIYLYLKDTLEKFKVFDDLEKKITLFTKILNKKFEGNKFIAVSKESGIEVFTGNKSEKIDATLLSSGEQHEIVLLYNLIFKISQNSLVLIDEPEISLHIDWQQDFLDDLEAISELSKPQFIIATHSPSIVGSRLNFSQEILI